MPKTKGLPKTGGRSKGTPNKITTDVKEAKQNFIQDNISSLQSEFDKLEPKDKLSFIEKLFKLILPTQIKAEILPMKLGKNLEVTYC